MATGQACPRITAAILLFVALLASASVHGMTLPPTVATIEGVVTHVDHDRELIEFFGGDIVIDASNASIYTPTLSGNAPFSVIEVGMRISASILDGSYPEGTPMVATLVRVDGHVPATVVGLISSVDQTNQRVVVAGRAFRFSDSTVVTTVDPSAGPRSVRDLQSGQRVSIELISTPEGLFARAIRILDVATLPLVRFRARVASIGATEWTFDSVSPSFAKVNVNAETRIIGNPTVGSFVVVTAVQQQGGYLATQIELEDRIPVSVTGRIVTMESDAWVIAPSELETFRIFLTPETQITGSPAIGKFASVSAEIREGRYVALRIVVFDQNPPRTVTFLGTVTSVTATELVIAEASHAQRRFIVTPQTQFHGGVPAVGEGVAVNAELQHDGTFVALSVHRSVPAAAPAQPMTVVGPVLRKEEDRWTVGRWTILLSPRTTITGDIEVGDRVRVIGERQADSHFVLAHIIYKE